MKISFKILTLVLVVAMLPSVAAGKSAKRGVSENQFSFASQMSAIAPGVGWYYNWGPAAGTGYKNEVYDFEDMEFIPMVWNGNYDSERIRTYCKEHPGTKYLLGFNEPNFANQANLTPQQAAELWPGVQALAKELGLLLVAPALNYSTGTYSQPMRWMDEFDALVGRDAYDFTAIHCYGGLSVLKNLSQQFYERYGKPVWVTEFCYWPGGAGDVFVAPDVQISSMIESVEWLEKTPYIYRYAWFKCVGPHDGGNKPNYGLEITMNGQGERELSRQGWVYTYMTDFDSEVWHPVGETFPASEYIASKSIMLDKGNNPRCASPIEISQLSAGASVDYQVEIPKASTYKLTLEVTGYGEPKRFDPSLRICLVNTDGSVKELAVKKFTLPGSEDVYTAEEFFVTLEGGRMVIRIEDANPFQPSGIHISTLRLDEASGVTGIEAEDASKVDVYTLSGVRVRRGVDAASVRNLPAGIYVAGDRKVVIK